MVATFALLAASIHASLPPALVAHQQTRVAPVATTGKESAGARAAKSPTLARDNRKNVNFTDVNDSQAFFARALRAASPRREEAARRAVELLAKMTLEEKVGQMTQLEIGMVTTGKNQEIRIDPAKLEKAVVKYGAGSILNVADQALPLDRWHDIIGQIQSAAKRTRLRIPVVYGIDTIHGANYVQGSTLFPQPLAMAATWNPDLMMRASEVAAAETRAAGITWNFSPVLDTGRQPLWPRLYETFGEDTYLATVMGVATVRGYEGTDISSPQHVAACLKHYMGYGLPLSGRDRTPAWIPEIYLREYVLPAFRAAVEAGARTVMVNSGEVNGVPVHVSHYMLTDVLRKELGFKGVAVSDWEDIKKLVNIHRVAATERDATRMAVLAGIDMSMVPSDYSFSDHLLALARSGEVPQSRIDEAVRRILTLKFELGLFENAMPDAALKARVGTPASRALSLEAAREAMTLLKNANNLLPLARSRKVLVTGPTADSLISLNNGWTYTWQGALAELYPKDRPTILGAVRAKAGEGNVTYVPGTTLDKELDVARAVEAAKSADVVIACLGEGGYAETPGNINDLTLDEAQLKLASALIATGKPVVLVLAEGRPRVINRIADGAGAILLAYNPGNEGGQAVADVLFGDYNPGGRLPFTYPRHTNALLTYDHKTFEKQDTSFGLTAFNPQFEFGHGLSYTTYKYGDLRLSRKTVDEKDKLTVTVTVTNTGQRAGNEVVQLYLRDVVASITPPDKRLKRFAKVRLEPGQSRTLNFELGRDDLSFIGQDNRPVVEPGDFDVLVGGLTGRFTLSPPR
jgi:beta-glucosidase